MKHYDDVIWMNFYRELKGPPIEQLLDSLTGMDPRNRRSIKCILGNCFEAMAEGHRHQNKTFFVAISLAKASFAHWKDYGLRHATYTRIKSSLEYLESNGLINMTLGHWDSPTGQGRCTRMRLTMKSGKILFGGNSYTEKTNIPPVLVRDNKKNLCNPRDFKDLRRVRRQVDGWNKQLLNYTFSISNEKLATIYNLRSLLGQKEEKPLLPKDLKKYADTGDVITLQRIFNQSSMKKGGRIYTDLQNINKRMRPEIRIDGGETKELDYKNYHIRMLYNKNGQNPLTDLYYSENWERALLKRSFTIAINSNSRGQAVLALQKHIKAKYDPLIDANDVLRWLESNHRGVVPFFYKEVGLDLMYEDSCMASLVIDHFLSKNEPILPIHDSFCVRDYLEPELRSIMEDTYKKHMGYVPVVQAVAA